MADTTPTPWKALPAPADLGHPDGTWLIVGPRTDNGEPHTIAAVIPCDDGTHPDRAQLDAQRITQAVNAAGSGAVEEWAVVYSDSSHYRVSNPAQARQLAAVARKHGTSEAYAAHRLVPAWRRLDDDHG